MQLSDCVLGAGVVIPAGVTLGPRTILGPGVELGAGVSLQPGVRLVSEQQDDWGDNEEDGKEDRLGPKAFLYEEDVESDEESLAGAQGGQDNWGEVYFTEDDSDSSEALGSISIY